MTENAKRSSDERFAAYACVVGAFQAQMIFGLVMRAFGVIYLIILEEFNTSATVASWIGATHTLVAGIACLFTTRFCQKYGCRTVAAVGASFHCTGFLVTAFANNVYVMYVSFGVMVAIGTACSTSSSFLIVSMMFTKKRAFFTSIASTGSSVAVLFMPVFVNFLFEYYGFQGCMLTLGGISLQGLVSAGLYGQHKPSKKTESTKESNRAREDTVKYQNNMADENRVRLSVTNSEKAGVDHKAFYTDEKPNGKVPIGDSHIETHKAFDNQDEGLKMPIRKTQSYVDFRLPRQLSTSEENAFVMMDVVFGEEIQPVKMRKKSIAWKPTAQLDISGQSGKKSKCTMPTSMQILKENPLVIGMILVNFSSTFVATSMSAYLPALAMERGVSETAALLLITYNGAASTIGRISVGFILDSKAVRDHKLSLYILCALFCGVVTLICPLSSAYWWISLCSCMCGLFIGTVFVQRTTVLADQVGIQRMPMMFGVVQSVNSIGFTLSTGFGGVMKDLLGTYVYYYYLSGSICAVMSIIVLISTIIKQRKDSQGKTLTM